MRSSKDEYYLALAKTAAIRSTCIHRKVGALLVRDDQILAMGVNGAPRGEPHCLDIGCAKPEHAVGMERCRAVHAEINCIIFSALNGTSIKDATLYTTQPCQMCQRALKNAGIERIVYSEEYA